MESMKEFLYGEQGSPTHRDETYERFLAMKALYKGRVEDKEKGAYQKVYDFFICQRGWRIRDFSEIVKKLLGKKIRNQEIILSGEKTLEIRKFSPKDLEKFCLKRFEEYGWETSEDCWEEN